MKKDKTKPYSGLLLNALAMSTLVTLLVALFSQLTVIPDNINAFFSSDTLYLPSVYQDLVVDGNSIREWHFNPSPNYFPDMLVYFVLMFLTKDLVVASFIFSIIQYILLGFLCVKLLKTIFPAASSWYNLFIYTVLAFFLLEFFFFTKNFYYLFYVLVNAYHTGAFVIALLCLYLTLNYISDKKAYRLVLIFVTGFLMVISDRLFVILYAAPVCLTCVLLIKRIGLRPAMYILAVNIVFVACGLILIPHIETDTYNMAGSSGPAELSVIFRQFGIFFEQMYDILTHFGIRMITLCLFIVSLFLMGWVFARSLKKNADPRISFYALFSMVFSAAVICAPMITGKYFGWDCFRYNIYPVYLAILNLAVFVFYFLQNRNIFPKAHFMLITLNVCLLLIGISQFSAAGLRSYFGYYPDNARYLDALAEKEGLKYGVANYWEAKKITMFSKKGLKVYPVFDDISFYQHVTNDAWFFDNIFNFVVITNFADTTLYQNKLKDIQFVSNTPEFRLIKTRPFLYSRSVGSGVVIKE